MAELTTSSCRTELSSAIRRVHVLLATEPCEVAATGGRSAQGSQVQTTVDWAKALSHITKADADAYAAAMRELFQHCWRGTDYVLNVLTRYYLAPLTSSSLEEVHPRNGVCSPASVSGIQSADALPIDGSASSAVLISPAAGTVESVCGRGAEALKRRRKEWFAEKQRPMTHEEAAALTCAINDEFALQTDKGALIVVLDVGSCHGGLLGGAPPWMHVLGIDLHPADGCPDSVVQGDWLTFHLVTSLPEEAEDMMVRGEHPTEGNADYPVPAAWSMWHQSCKLCLGQPSFVSDADGCPIPHAAFAEGRDETLRRRLMAIYARSVDVVVMCYLLSYMPSGALRWEAVRRAVEVLRDGGLLFLLDAKRGAHRKQWHRQWTRTLEAFLPLRRVRCDVSTHTVSMLFVVDRSSVADPTEPRDGTRELDF